MTFCPPRLPSRLPPTNATFARPHRADSSPVESTRTTPSPPPRPPPPTTLSHKGERGGASSAGGVRAATWGVLLPPSPLCGRGGAGGGEGGQPRAPHVAQPRPLDQPRHLVETVAVPRHQEQPQV